MKVIFIGSDRSILKKESNSYKRMLDYASLFDELNIVIFSRGKSENLNVGNLKIYPTNSINRWFFVLDGFLKARKILNEISTRYEDYVVSVQDPFESGIIGVFLKKIFGVRLQVQVHTDFLSPYFSKGSFLNRIRLLFTGVCLKNADGIRVVSERIKSSIVKTYEIQPSKIDVLPIFVDQEIFKTSGGHFDLRHLNPSWQSVFLTVARLEKEKNLFFLLGVFSRVITKNRGIVWLIVGEGSLKERLERTVDDMGLAENIIFLGYKDELLDIYRSSNFYIQASFYEGFGLSLVEAFLCGLPIITTSVRFVIRFNSLFYYFKN
jgi:glycosyltransferase involved in cell wall biosynthesis